MTRFACPWVEDGRIVGPTEVMPFDDTVFHLLGRGLQAIGSEAELLPDTGTYGRRAVECQRVPEVLVDSMGFTL